MEKKYSIQAPIGNVIVPKELMTEQELRQYAAQVTTDPVWKEKMLVDPIEEVLQSLGRAGYNITG